MCKKFKLVSLLIAALFLIPALTSCGGKKQGEVLEVVPADAPIILYGNASETLSQMGIEGDKINDPLKSLFQENGVDIDEVQAKMPDVDMFTQDCALFADKKSVWMVAAIKDSGKFKKFMEENDFDIEKEEGVEILSNRDFKAMLKDDFFFVCINLKKGEPVTDIEEVKRLLKLGDESFAKNEQTRETARQIIEKKPLFYGLVNLKKIDSLVDDSDYTQALAALGLVIEDVNYVQGQFNITDKGIEAEAMFLDSKFKPAKSNIPLGSIKASDLKYASVPDPVYCVGVALSAKTISAILEFAGRFGAIPADVQQLLSGIDGTAGFVGGLKDSPNTLAMMLTCTDGESANAFGQLAMSQTSQLNAQTSGNVLRLTMKNGPSASSAPSFASQIDGCVAGGVFDFSAFAKETGLSGEDDDLGTLDVMLKSENGAPVLRAVWNVKDPIKTLFKFAENAELFDRAIEKMYENIDVFLSSSYYEYDSDVYAGGYSEYDYAVTDSVAYYDY